MAATYARRAALGEPSTYYLWWSVPEGGGPERDEAEILGWYSKSRGISNISTASDGQSVLRHGDSVVMAASTTVNTHRGPTRSTRTMRRIGRVLSPGGDGMVGETWKRDIVRQLKHRDRTQYARFQDLIRFCTRKLS